MLRSMLEDRAPLYREVATATVPTSNRTTDDVVAEVLTLIPGRDPR
jgi:shikimate kinase